MVDQVLDFGDGGDWNGRSQQSVTASWQTDFEGSSSSVEFPITAGQTARIVAENLKNAWNACYPHEASIDSYNEPETVRFDRNGKKPTGMAIKVGNGNSTPLPKDGSRVPVDAGVDVGNVK